MTIGDTLKQARLNAGLTQKQLGENAVWQILLFVNMSQENQAQDRNTKKIAAALNVSVIDLADFDTATEILAEDINQIRMRYGQETPQYYRMIEAFSTLNHTGAEKAAVAVEDLSKVPEYRREDGAL